MNNILSHEHAITYVDLSAIQHNCNHMKKLSPSSKLLAMVKGNAYGHNIEDICTAIAPNVDGFGVACINEAIRIRKIGVDKTILLIKGVTTQEELQLANNLNLHVVIHNLHQLDLLEKTSLKNLIGVWLKVDTGMHRLGFHPSLLAETHRRLMVINNVIKPIVLMTHLSNANDVTGAQTQAQTDNFLKIIGDLEGEKSVANSNAIFGGDFGFDWMRIGGALYGVSTMPDKTGLELGLKPAMTLVSRLVAIQKLSKGESIGYGGIWTCPEDMSIGIIDIGYADGYPRNVTAGTPVVINNIRCPVIGMISMNMLFVDLRACAESKIGDTVILWGSGLAVEEVAKHANTFCLELLCHLNCKSYAGYY